MRPAAPPAPHALLRLRAHHPAPVRVELEFLSVPRRFALAFGSWALCWGALPFAIWLPPHYPWVAILFLVGIYLPYRFWNGKYRVHHFAGGCPRCGHPLSLDHGSKIDLPHTLTCFHCHFEPALVVLQGSGEWARARGRIRIAHRASQCGGSWAERWWHDETWVICDACGARHPATGEARQMAEAENECGRLLRWLADDGRFRV